eukprot:gene21300-27328_t
MTRCTHFNSWVAGLEYNGIAQVADQIKGVQVGHLKPQHMIGYV